MDAPNHTNKETLWIQYENLQHNISELKEEINESKIQAAAKDKEIERLQGGIGYLLERSGHKPCNRLDLEAIMGRILAGEDVYSYRLEAKQDA